MTVLIFDAGGVLVELGPPPIKNTWLPPGKTLEDIWQDWISMGESRRFESGQTSTDEFATEMIGNLDLQTDRQSFIDHFRAWPIGLYPGTIEWLGSLKPVYTTAMLSNTNELHWRRMKDEMGLGDAMDHYFLSHKLGLLKPDRGMFEAVLQLLEIDADEAVFFDDNKGNVDAAATMGIRSFHVAGPDALRSAVESLEQ